ncbi:MAG TPA: hypothetical protein VFB52_13695, partial [Solirubrobacterales bacterium]|nr:hypothetical protein [Solirubrobacterales bacterium]
GTSTYVQGADELNTYGGGLTFTFSPGCAAPRRAVTYLLVDVPNPTKITETDITGYGEVIDPDGSKSTVRVDIGPFVFNSAKFEPGTPTTHTVTLITTSDCSAGSGVTASAGAVDVIGTR